MTRQCPATGMGCPWSAPCVGECRSYSERAMAELTTPDYPAQTCGTCRFYWRLTEQSVRGNCTIRLPAWVDDTQLSRAVADVHRCDLWRLK